MNYKDVGKLNRLANLFYRTQGCQLEMDYDFSEATHPQEKACFEMAKVSKQFWLGNKDMYLPADQDTDTGNAHK